MIDRRKFLKSSLSLSAAGVVASQNVTDSNSTFNKQLDLKASGSNFPNAPVFVATWPFGKFACEKAFEIASTNQPMLDAIEQGIGVTESDIKNASVGIGGIPNAEGKVELDACIMAGPQHQAGSVAGIQDIAHPISVARKVMEQTPHVMLVGEGAKKFALSNGFAETNLLSEKQRRRWEDRQKESNQPQPEINEDHHDTIAMLGVDTQGNLYGGCSTSGWGYKIPGRVGDSPIIGGGLYVDNTVGAAGATGLGENVMRYCGSFLVVEMMRQGANPTEACVQAIRRIESLDPKSFDELSVNFIALAKDGTFGAAGTNKGFKFSVTTKNQSEILTAKSMTDNPIGPEGGNRK
ncbi:MAG: N(4)-(beta-N-acetylglucosaminyl)-L-asparaginase [Planctomycetota bacterium]